MTRSSPWGISLFALCACAGGNDGNNNPGGRPDLPDPEVVDGDQDGFDSTEDCNDANAAIFPGATETCNGLDDNCDSTIDDGLMVTYYRDSDGDTYGDPASSATACSPPDGFVTDNTDCDDGNRIVRPGGIEVCDLLGVDEDCNGVANDDDPGAENKRIWYVDADEDGYGIKTTIASCFEQPGMATVDNDCNDADFAINPGVPEICDPLDKDEDCDGFSDVNDPEGPEGQPLYYIDMDGDDDGDMSDPGQYFCDGVPPGYSTLGTDCDDGNEDINPRRPENCRDLIDNDCNGAVDDWGPIPDIPLDTSDLPIEGDSSYGGFGWTVQGMGDLDADGHGDFAVGSDYYDSYKGGVFLFNGPVTETGTVSAEDTYTALLTGTVTYGYFGFALDTAGDVNADGYDDVLVGTQNYSKAGYAYVFLGPFVGDSTADSAEGIWSGEANNDLAGSSVAGDFDADADGWDDYLIGAQYADSYVGAAYLIYGPGT